ncbi:hypothetical protein HDU85_000431 [Gaertneriomyces sp. JEL0708]|nr:hypothetical protein HDU85_000431 [Gaertneriomyces sp. JEL0708]
MVSPTWQSQHPRRSFDAGLFVMGFVNAPAGNSASKMAAGVRDAVSVFDFSPRVATPSAAPFLFLLDEGEGGRTVFPFAVLDEGPLNEDPLDEGTVDEDPLDEDPLDEDPLDEDPLDEDPLDEDPLDEDPLDEDPLGEDPLDEDPLGEDPLDDDPTNEGEDETVPLLTMCGSVVSADAAFFLVFVNKE